MPLGIDQLTNLRDLTYFKAGSSSSVGKQLGGELKDLKSLVNLRGKLEIMILENHASETLKDENVCDSGYLEHTKNLKVVKIKFNQDEQSCETDNEALIAKLQPNRNVMKLSLHKYDGTEIPRWGRVQDDWAIILPNLVKIELHHCERLRGIPLLSNLKHLKCLSLEQLNNLEYMDTNAVRQDSFGSKDIPFFPFLESLTLMVLKRLKGWWGRIGEGESSSGMLHSRSPFPRLSRLIIVSCPELKSFPACPFLESLLLLSSNKSLRITPGEGSPNLDLTLRVEQIDSLGYLSTLPGRRLTHISIIKDDELKMNSEIDEVLKSSSTLRSLEISSCERPTSVSGVLKHLTALQSLSLMCISSLVDDPDPDDDMPWRSLSHNLRSLTLWNVKPLQILPTGMKHLTALQSLSINSCDLKGLPEWISCLSSLHSLIIEGCDSLQSLGTIQNMTSLEKLEIRGCPYLEEACQIPRGKEWPNIRHIPHIYIIPSCW